MNPQQQQAALAQSLMGYGQQFQQQNGSATGTPAISGQAAAANPGLLGAIPTAAQQPAQPLPSTPMQTGMANASAPPQLTPAQQLALAQQQALLMSGVSGGTGAAQQ